MFTHRNRLLAFATPVVLSAIALVAVAGCGGGDPFTHIAATGHVLFDGKPLPKGKIIFVPTKDGQQRAQGAVTDGDYSIPAGEGPSPGEYKVMIYTDDVPPVAMDDPEQFTKSEFKKKSPVNPIADEFNLDTKLRATFVLGKENKFDYTTTSRAKNSPKLPPMEMP